MHTSILILFHPLTLNMSRCDALPIHDHVRVLTQTPNGVVSLVATQCDEEGAATVRFFAGQGCNPTDDPPPTKASLRDRKCSPNTQQGGVGSRGSVKIDCAAPNDSADSTAIWFTLLVRNASCLLPPCSPCTHSQHFNISSFRYFNISPFLNIMLHFFAPSARPTPAQSPHAAPLFLVALPRPCRRWAGWSGWRCWPESLASSANTDERGTAVVTRATCGVQRRS